MKLKALGISYQNAPVEIRELAALDESSARRWMATLKSVLGIRELLVVSTCNRTEIYYNHPEDKSAEIISLLAIEKGILPQADLLRSYFQHFNQEQAIRHLFRVAMGLESQVVGDLQISNQIKRAYQASVDEGLAEAFLHRLMHTIFFTNKKVVQQTAFRDGAASVSYAAVEMLQEFANTILEPRILVLGVGEIGRDVVKNLSETDLKNVTLINRTQAKAEKLAENYGYEVRPFSEVGKAIQEADIVVSAISRPEPFITKSQFIGHKNLNFKYLFDLSIPRSIEPEIEEIAGVLLYNVDTINNQANEVLERRKEAVPQVEALIEEAILEFNDWSKEMLVSPVIHKFKNALEEIRKGEIARYTKSLDDKERQNVEKITKNIIQKIVKLPVLELKSACKRGEADTLVDVLNDLFNLEKQPEKIQR